MTHVQERRQGASLLKSEICRLLEWTELEYAEFQYKTGCQYLQAYIPNDPQGIDELLNHKLFWNWWKNQWHNRDFAFMLDSEKELSDLNIGNKRLIYMHYHDAVILSLEITPNSIILGNAYKSMIGQLIKKEVA